jgi:hypothetical protein
MVNLQTLAAGRGKSALRPSCHPGETEFPFEFNDLGAERLAHTGRRASSAGH